MAGRATALHINVASRLTPKERKIFNILLDTVRCNRGKTVLRVAGGWVRDKLLGLESDDVDIALDDTNGSAFANLVNSYMEQHLLPTHHVGIISPNPEQSKHLETARMRVEESWVDFVNLRTEMYAKDSRIPSTMSFGTPEEDAMRRDFTINALFFNINSKQVEDYTKLGLEDLRRGLVRTPLPAIETLVDDPLRALRGVRFAARFGFSLDDDLKQAARTDRVHIALQTKVSRERIGIEFERMIFGQNANVAIAFRLLYDLGLLSVVLEPPFDNGGARPGKWELGIRAVEMANSILEDSRLCGAVIQEELPPPLKQQCIEKPARLNDECLSLNQPKTNNSLLFLSAAMLPLHGRTIYREKKKRNMPAAAHVLQNSLKMKSKYVAYIMSILENVDRLNELSRADPPASRVELGLLVRALQEFWLDAIVVACSWELCNNNKSNEGEGGGGDEANVFDSAAKDNSNAILERYICLKNRVEELNLKGVWQTQPLMNGKELMERLGIPRGPRVGEILHEQVKWQLSNPNGRAIDFEGYFRHNFGGEGEGNNNVNK